MRTNRTLIALIVICAATSGCGPLPDPRAVYSGDLQSPVFLGVRAVSATSLEVEFHEPVTARIADYACKPDSVVTSVTVIDTTVHIDLADPLSAGAEYMVYGTAYDESGNSMKFITKVFGFNPAVPSLRINEFTTKGSGNHPDCVELIAESSGNLAGVTIYEGTPASWAERKVLPATPVETGDYIVVHFKPEGLETERDEVDRRDEAVGLDALPSAWDFWVTAGDGLSGNNGAITLCDSPGGAVLDAVLYSNRTSSSDERYSGFGSRQVLEQAEFLTDAGAWRTVEPYPRPEDAVNPDDSTATRSICRLPGIDTDAREDWYVVPTRGVSFGEENSREVYRK